MNIVKGTIFAIVYVCFTIIIPVVTFSLLREYVVQGLPLDFTQEDLNNIVFWVTAFGLVISGCAFFTHSSPKQSIRRGTFALIQVLVNCLYLWSYKFSGATEIIFNLEFEDTSGFLSLNLQQMVLVFLGIYFLTIILKVYDVIDFTINREKIRNDRMKE
ncbi:MAG: hypothetical protein ACFE8L_00175 [Candidatus Hodarchaeota archaeon]